MENKQKTICLCAIVKNEEKVIGRLIDSCIKIIDYWVIIDTGSTDNTKKIIDEKLGNLPGELSDSIFIDFGYNRTELVQKAFKKADYLLLADADMTVHTDKNFDKSKLYADMYHIRYTGGLDFAQPLFVSGHIQWRYEGVTHEYLTADKRMNPVELKSLTITHHFDGGTRSNKLERDKELLEKDILDNPGNVRSYFYLAQTYSNMGLYEQSLKYYQERVNRGGWQEEVYYSMYQIGIMLYNQQRYADAKVALLNAYEYRPIRFEALYFLGVLCRELKQYYPAAIFQEKVLSMPYPENDVLFVHRNQYDFLADFELGIDYYWMKDFIKAEKHCRKVAKFKGLPDNIKEQNKKNLEYALERQGKIKGKEGKPFTVASMFTVGTPYQAEVHKLKIGLDKQNVKYELVGVKPAGTWEKNTQMKPEVIRGVMEKYQTPILWLDADAEVKGPLDFFNNIKGDICYYTLTWNKGKSNEFNEMLVGTLWFDCNDRVINFLNNWIALNSQNDLPDGKNFQTIMESDTSLKRVAMPPEYLKIFDNDLIVAPNPIIVHNQASRRFKNDIVIKRNEVVEKILKAMTKEYKTCAIVGNGPFKNDLSKSIDKAFVMRCNNFELNGFSEIGSRVDINISSLNPEIIPDKQVPYPIFGVLPISNDLYQKYTTAKQMHVYWQQSALQQVSLGNNIISYDNSDDYSKLFTEVASAINAFPTVGLMGIATARWLGFKNIIITGFTFFQSDKSHYFKEEKVIPSTHHDVEKERLLVKQWVENDKDRRYILDELTENALNITIDVSTK